MNGCGCIEFELEGGAGLKVEMTGGLDMEISVEPGFGIESTMAETSISEISLVHGDLVPKDKESDTVVDYEMEFGGIDFAFVYVGPALAPIEIRSCYGLGYWIPSRPWLSNESWKY